ncbi:hypothetical protein BHE74_00056499 [Ensete ventricosum]|nr:hypothetical protein BHE74_00056499 [Ensete ventricosum]RZS28461.1 hypothetical protein BHM03_00062058 [Ensete ventricosum]
MPPNTMGFDGSRKRTRRRRRFTVTTTADPSSRSQVRKPRSEEGGRPSRSFAASSRVALLPTWWCSNDESKRETPAVVCFGEKQRFVGTAGAAGISNPFLPFNVTEGPDGFPLIHVNHLGEQRTFTPTQILAMVLSDLKRIAEKNLHAAVVDCCIGIPVYFTEIQRRAVLDAATIAGLHPLRLFHETTASALA